MSYLREKRKVIHQFIKQLREVWDEDYPNPIRAFRMYLGFLRKYADPPGTRDKDKLALWTDWQLKDMEMCIYNPKINPEIETLLNVILRSRRTAKTRDGTTMWNFWACLGYDCGWRAPIGGQLQKAGFWFSRSPFVEKVSVKDRYVRYISPLMNTLDIAPLTPGSSKGSDCDCMFYDELGDVMKRLQAYVIYLQSRPMVANSDWKHICSSSTPWRDTAFQDEWEITQRLEKKYDTKLMSEHTADDCSWITPEFLESERENYPAWYIEAMYYCKWTVPYGAVFERIIEVHDPKYLDKPTADHTYSAILATKKPRLAGVDHNAGDRDSPHYLVTGDYDDNFVYVLDEYQFTDLSFLFEEKFRHISMEIEDGLYNIQFTDQEKMMGKDAIYQEFSKELKMQRVQEIRNRWMIIDKERAPLTYSNVLNAAYSQTSRLPELEKRTDQHGLDCVIHLMHQTAGGISVFESSPHQPIKRLFKPQRRILRV